jgi:hypothetical protein
MTTGKTDSGITGKDTSGSDAAASVDKTTSVNKNDQKQSDIEIGGPSGPEPTRYGDWEKGGRCSDF